ncbi:alpha-tectorin-like isoform X2 [Dreissena polymorpha]|uniref:alpha-tectorin-like isoform X2 n=1 Tax=Dreissena polymorpha TaxID=45954 RepID=UPI00226475DD|nr:alpha-tectorin-like isoform X2 [Dreissena polymorpha]
MKVMKACKSTRLASVSFVLLLARYAHAALYDHSSATVISINDDTLTPLNLPVPIKFRDMDINNIYISDNGLVTTDATKETFADAIKTNSIWIAPFGGDVAPDVNSKIKHATYLAPGTPPPSGVNVHVNQVYPDVNFSPTSAYVITWENVDMIGDSSFTGNTFQLTLTTDGTKSYAIFLYDVISWYPGVTGVNAGDGNVQRVCNTDTAAAQQLPQKTNIAACGVDPGVVVLRIDQTGIWGPDCVTVSQPEACTTQATTPRLSACACKRRRRKRSGMN